MATIIRKHGQDAAGAFYGYTPLGLRVNYSGKFTADAVDGTTGDITVGGWTKARQIIQTFGSIVYSGARTDNDYIFVIVDQPTFNQGDGQGGNAGATTGFLALQTALQAALGGTTSSYTVASGSSITNQGAFTLA
jgi:hypothetical protein